MAGENANVGLRWYDEVWNKKRPGAIDEMFAPDGIMHGLATGNDEVRGPAGFKQFYAAMTSACPDVHIRVDQVIEQGDMVALRWTATLTHTGEGLGFPPTNRRATIEGLGMARIANGRVVEAWNQWDNMGLLEQLGQLPGK
jgi:steroid delta-isomerase-like uncharacterized protein